MPTTIVPYQKLQGDGKTEAQLREIFFESSTRKTFKDEAEKDAFFEKYLGWYLTHYPEFAWVAMGERVLGYVVVSPQSEDTELLRLQPHLKIFQSYFASYPAHLHINCHAESRGLGVGRELLETVFSALKKQHIHGLHIMTGADARNRSFYARLGFDFETQLDFLGSPILFMGKSL